MREKPAQPARAHRHRTAQAPTKINLRKRKATHPPRSRQRIEVACEHGATNRIKATEEKTPITVTPAARADCRRPSTRRKPR